MSLCFDSFLSIFLLVERNTRHPSKKKNTEILIVKNKIENEREEVEKDFYDETKVV